MARLASSSHCSVMIALVAGAFELVACVQQGYDPERVVEVGESRDEPVMSSSWWVQGAARAAAVLPRTLSREPWRPDLGPSSPSARRSLSTFLPDDPGFEWQWGLGAVNAPEAWRVASVHLGEVAEHPDAPTPTIALIDSGCSDPSTGRLHPDLARFVDARGTTIASPIVRQFHLVDAEVIEGRAPDDFGHGVAVAGILAAQTRNQVGMASVTWHGSIDCIRVLDEYGNTTDRNVARAIELAADLGDKLVNLSVQSTKELPLTKRALQRFVEAGGLAVVARGNAPGKYAYRASYPAMYSLEGTQWLGLPAEPWQGGVISVGALRQDGDLQRLTSSSLRGGLTVAAPGAKILTLAYETARNQDCTPVRGEPGLALCTGTSFAAPFVTGALALLWAVEPTLSNYDVRERLRTTALPLQAQQSTIQSALQPFARASSPLATEGATGCDASPVALACLAENAVAVLDMQRLLVGPARPVLGHALFGRPSGR